MTTTNEVIRKKHLKALEPSRLAQAINEADSYAKNLADFCGEEYWNVSEKGDLTILSLRLLTLQSHYCFNLLDLLIKSAEGIVKEGFIFLLTNLYDALKDNDKIRSFGYFSVDFSNMSAYEEQTKLIETPSYKKHEMPIVSQIKDIVRDNSILQSFCDEVLKDDYYHRLLNCNTLVDLLQTLLFFCNDLVCFVSRKFFSITGENVALCYDYWNNTNEKSWELECDYDFCAWKQGLLKHREKNIRAKYDEHLNKLYESGFLDFIIEKMDISYQEGSSLSIYDDVYEERNGVFYPEGHHAHDKGLSVEQILAEHAVEELLLADGTPNPDSVGRYLLLHVAEIGYMEIKSFFEFINFKKYLMQLAEQEGLLPSSRSHASCKVRKSTPKCCWRPENETQSKLCRKLVEKGYCRVDGDHYQWTATNEEFGCLIYYCTTILHIGTHPSSGRIQWDMFCCFFGINENMKKQAQNAVTSLKHNLKDKNHHVNCEKAEKIKRIVKIVKR